MTNVYQIFANLLHSARTVFTELPETKGEFRSFGTADQQRRLAYTLLTRNPGVAADLFTEANRQEQRDAR